MSGMSRLTGLRKWGCVVVSLCLLLSTSMMTGVRGQEKEKPTSDKPPAEKTAPKTKIKKMNVFKLPDVVTGPITLCPGQSTVRSITYNMEDMNDDDEAYINVYSANPDVASASYDNESDTLTITAGANDSDKTIKTTIYVEFQPAIQDVLKAGSKPLPRDGFIIEVKVRPKKKCIEKKNKTGGSSSVTDGSSKTKPIVTYIGSPVTIVPICIGETVPIVYMYPNAEKGDIGGVTPSNSDPAVASMDNKGQAPAMGGKSLQLNVTGIKEGFTVITIQEARLSAENKLETFKRQWVVQVRDCAKESKFWHGYDFSGWKSALKYGKTETGDNNRNETPPKTSEGGKTTPEAPKDQQPGIDKEHSMLPGIKGANSMVANGLASSVFMTDAGNIIVHLPQDMAAGDTVSGTMILQPNGSTPEEKKQNAETLKQYTVSVESTAVVSDGPPTPFTVKLPAATGTHLETSVVISDDEHKPMTKIPFSLPQVAMAVSSETATASDFHVPDTHMAGKPIVCKGRFDGDFKNTSMTVGGEETMKLAESPRSFVAIPRQETIGENQPVDLKTGNVEVKTQIATLLPESSPQEQSGHEMAQQMIHQMCNDTVDMYQQNLHAMVDEAWHAPKPPTKGLWTAVLAYDITRNGGVQNVRVVTPSGYAPLDQSAIQRVYELQGQFGPLPSCYDKDALPVTHTFKVIYH